MCRLVDVMDAKKARVAAVTHVSYRYSTRVEGFWSQLHAGGETWVVDFEPESKLQLMEWHHTTSTRKKKLKSVQSAGKTLVTYVTVVNFLPGRLADSLQGKLCTHDEAVQRNNLTECEMHGFFRPRKTVLKNDGLQVWCCEAR
jgi:hypothetical protein